MDDIFSQLAMNTVSLVGRAAFGAASTLAGRQIASYVHRIRQEKAKSKQKDTSRMSDLLELQQKFHRRITSLTPIIDLIDMAGARGKSILTSVLPVTAELKALIDDFTASMSLSSATLGDSETSSMRVLAERLTSTRISSPGSDHKMSITSSPQISLDDICKKLAALIQSLDEHVPYLQLALVASGVNFNTKLNATISLSRFLQASTSLQNSYRDNIDSESFVLVGQVVKVRVYSLFFGSVRKEGKTQWTWKEEFPLANLMLERARYSFRIHIERDFNDGLVHDNDEDAADKKDLLFDISSIRKLYYANAGRLLKIEDSESPCLIMKFERRQGKTNRKENACWYGFELLQDNCFESCSHSSDGDESSNLSESDSDQSSNSSTEFRLEDQSNATVAKSSSSLAHLEYMLKLASLESSRQMSHTDASDEVLLMYMQSD
eukprot:Partr_v1_DN26338_c1_g1_i3_m42966 putative RanGTP-binding protein